MSAILNLTQKIQAYGDKTVSSNPRKRHVDWTRDMSSLSVKNPRSDTYEILPGATEVVFNGTRSTTVAVNTEFSLALSTLNPSRYRFTWTTGPNPSLRVGRSLDLTGVPTTITVNSNATVTVTTGTPQFSGVVVGDTVFVPHTTTGDSANVFSAANSGYWTVIATSSTSNIQLARPAGVDFSGTTETQSPTSAGQFVAFSASGVQIGDAVDISSGFSFQDTFSVIAVTDTFFEVISTKALPNQTGISPGASGLVFYTDTKSFLYVEVDQNAVVRLNGSSDNNDRVEPREPGNPDLPGVFMKMGPSWALSIVNRSSVTMNVIVIHAE